VEIGEAHALGVESVEVRGFQDGISVGGEIPVALIIREDEENIGAPGGGGGRGGEGGESEQEGKSEG
jgi:hypothetical protein